MLQRCKIFLNGCNITTFFDTIQSFLSEYHKKHIKYNFLSERNGVSNTIRRCKYELPSKEKEVDWINYTTQCSLFPYYISIT